MLDRYDRQNRIPGWNQEALKSAKVAVIGSDYLAVQVLLGLAGLGVGDILVVDNKRQGLADFFTGRSGASNAESLESLLKQINPEIQVTGLHWKLHYRTDTVVLSDRTLIIEATNDPNSKHNALMFAQSHRIRTILASANQTQANVQTYTSGDITENLVQEEFAKAHQGILPSGVGAGLVLDKVRRYLLPLPEDSGQEKQLNYDLAVQERFPQAITANGDVLPFYDFSDRRVLMVGAGSLGNFVGVQLALLGAGNLDIVDYDVIESVNLNRQLLLFGRLGELKSRVLAERLAVINPVATYTYFEQRLDATFEEYFAMSEPHIILDCVDNFRTRATLDAFSKRFGIPLVSGGTNFQSGQVITYVPGQTACLDCHLGVAKHAEAEAELEAEHCVLAPEPSVIVSNQLIGNLMAAEAFVVLSGSQNLKPVKSSLKYDSTVANSVGTFGQLEPCKCNLVVNGGGHAS